MDVSILLQRIREVENEHNQLVDEYFQMKDNVKQALTTLNNDPSAIHLNTYNSYLTISEALMRNIRLKRLSLTSLICDLHKHGVFLDDGNESDDDEINSSLDEGIDRSFLDRSSKLSSLNNSDTNQHDDIFAD